MFENHYEVEKENNVGSPGPVSSSGGPVKTSTVTTVTESDENAAREYLTFRRWAETSLNDEQRSCLKLQKNFAAKFQFQNLSPGSKYLVEQMSLVTGGDASSAGQT